MKPFNLERAIAGDAMTTKSGQAIYDIAWHPMKRRFVGQVHQGSYFYIWDEHGIREQAGEEQTDHYDLVMAPRTVTKWRMGDINDSYLKDSKESVEDQIKKLPIDNHLYRVVKIEYEE